MERKENTKDYKELYEKIANSEWFKKAYHDKSLGECPIVVEEWEDSEGEPENAIDGLDEATKHAMPDPVGRLVLFNQNITEPGYSLFQMAYMFKCGAAWRAGQIPKLPDNLDKAAEEYEKESLASKFPTRDPSLTKADIIYIFKAGAEWMAGQGETHEHYVIREVAGHDVGPAIVVYPETFEVGDNVIVQIRKK